MTGAWHALDVVDPTADARPTPSNKTQSEPESLGLEALRVGHSLSISYESTACFCETSAKIEVNRLTADRWGVTIEDPSMVGSCGRPLSGATFELGPVGALQLDSELQARRGQTTKGCTSVYAFELVADGDRERFVDESCQEYAEDDEVLTFQEIVLRGPREEVAR